MENLMSELFPPIVPYLKTKIKVSKIHELYLEECGNPEGRPLLFLHGGPGAGIIDDYRRYFDPSFYRIILFDQRGSGKSTPYASLKENTTWDLVADIEKIREFLKVDKWMLFGGSWGSTLALVYAEAHPSRVTSLLIRGIFLGRKEDIEWFYQFGASEIYPEYWKTFLEPIPKDKRDNLIAAYDEIFQGDNKELKNQALLCWAKWEAHTLCLTEDKTQTEEFSDANKALALAQIECHYFKHNCWLEGERSILANANKIEHIPTKIIHGRYDVICKISQAYQLAYALPKAEFQICQEAGHSGLDPQIKEALVASAEEFKKFQ